MAAVRLLLTAGLTVMVWREAGPWTGIAVGLIALNAELQAFVSKHKAWKQDLKS